MDWSFMLFLEDYISRLLLLVPHEYKHYSTELHNLDQNCGHVWYPLFTATAASSVMNARLKIP
jgi:hypothetical protein